MTMVLKRPELLMSDLPSEDHIRIHRLTEIFILMFATISIVFTAITIVKATGKGMGIYKHYLLHELFWNYAFDTFLCLWMPIELFPLQCSYSAGIFSRATVGFQQFAVVAASFFAVGKIFALFIAITYRYSQALPPDSNIILRKSVNPNVYMYITIFLLMQVAINGPVFINFSDHGKVKFNLSLENPALEHVYNTESSTVCFGGNKDSMASLVYVFMGIIALLFFSTISFMLIHLWKLMKDGSAMSNATYRIQLMLFKSIRMQLICTFIILGIPVTISLVSVAFQLRKAPIYIMMATTIACLHSTCNCLILIYYVRPYRQFLTRRLNHSSKADSRIVSAVNMIGTSRTL